MPTQLFYSVTIPVTLWFISKNKKQKGKTLLVREPAIKSMVGSSGRQRVQTDVVSNLEIEIPSLDEQRKIGFSLKCIDDKIELNNKINNNLSIFTSSP